MARRSLSMATVRPIRTSASIRLADGTRSRASGFVRLELDQRSLQRGRNLLDRYRDAPLQKRMGKASLAAAKVLEWPMRDAAPVSRDKDPGVMRASTRARPARTRTTYQEGKGWRSRASTEALVGPVTGYSHLPIRGHRIVTRSGQFTGRRSRANPYVDSVIARHHRKAIAEMRAYIFQRGLQEDLARRIVFGRNAG